MNNIYNLTKNLIGDKVGTISISMYQNKDTDMNFFFIESDNENMIKVSSSIEDALKIF